MDVSIVGYYGIQASRCGYCKGTKCSKSHGMHAYTMTTQDYQDLIDRGWRRSGDYCYKPNNAITCCPSYTIKCDALEFKLSKSHKKILKRMNRFLRDGKKDKNEEISSHTIDGREAGVMDAGLGMHDEPKAPDVQLPQIDLKAVKNANFNTNSATKHCANTKPTPYETDAVDGAVSALLKNQSPENQIPRKKAKQMRLERRQAKLVAKGVSNETIAEPTKNSQPKEKTLADFIGETTPNDKHKLKIVLVNSATIKVEDVTFNLYRKYQMLVHKDPPERLTLTRLERFLYNSPLKLKLVHVRSEEFRVSLESSYALYEKYQTRIHKDPPESVEDYLTFLGRSPLKHNNCADGPPQGYGSFHQQYWLDDKLIAVGVIDILPYCLSSVYFFYDPDYSFLSLGTYASLREIEFVQQLSKLVPALKYYYMGFYIQSCPKMRYKGKLVPSYLLCPETYSWHLLTDEIRNRLDASKYQRFNTDPAAKDKDEFTRNDLSNVILLLGTNKCITYAQYIGLTRASIDEDERDMISEYGKLVGKTCAHRMIYVNM